MADTREGELLEAVVMAGGAVRLTIRIDPDKEGEHFRVTAEQAQAILASHMLGSRVTVSTQVTVTSVVSIRDAPKPPAEPEAKPSPLCGECERPNDGGPCILPLNHKDRFHKDADDIEWAT